MKDAKLHSMKQFKEHRDIKYELVSVHYGHNVYVFSNEQGVLAYSSHNPLREQIETNLTDLGNKHESLIDFLNDFYESQIKEEVK